nr:hypothetical protein GCM10020241_48630 [Streptoalloteichus tenebrarius]
MASPPGLTASMVIAPATPANTSTDPTDRSIPDVMITNVMPTESTSSTAASISNVWKLYSVGKEFGLSALNTA